MEESVRDSRGKKIKQKRGAGWWGRERDNMSERHCLSDWFWVGKSEKCLQKRVDRKASQMRLEIYPMAGDVRTWGESQENPFLGEAVHVTPTAAEKAVSPSWRKNEFFVKQPDNEQL
jgi:hypothetical protein